MSRFVSHALFPLSCQSSKGVVTAHSSAPSQARARRSPLTAMGWLQKLNPGPYAIGQAATKRANMTKRQFAVQKLTTILTGYPTALSTIGLKRFIASAMTPNPTTALMDTVARDLANCSIIRASQGGRTGCIARPVAPSSTGVPMAAAATTSLGRISDIRSLVPPTRRTASLRRACGL